MIAAYGGGIALIAAVTIFILRSVSHADVVVLTNGSSTPTPTIVDVFHGIRPDAVSPLVHAKAVKVAVASPTPAGSPSPGPSASPTPQPAKVAKHVVKHHAASAGATTDTSDVAESAHAAPVRLAQVPPQIERAAATPPPAPAAAPVATEAPAPATAAPKAADENEPIYAPQRVVDAQVRVAVQPDFPDVDRERGAHGTSVVLVTIDPKGNVVSAAVGTSSGYPGLDRAAVSAARASQFVAPRINGHPATETYRVVYDFSQ